MTFNILLFDDNIDDLELFSYLLSDCFTNATIYQAETLGEACAIADEHTLDCAFVDYNMPTINGIEATHHLRSQHKMDAPVILLTGGLDEHIKSKAAPEIRHFFTKDNFNNIEALKEVMTSAMA